MTSEIGLTRVTDTKVMTPLTRTTWVGGITTMTKMTQVPRMTGMEGGLG